MGVNLPAHLVVIKFTQQMVAGAWREYSESQILQMAGRAGRPQFCDSATVVIMTTQERKKYYDSLIEGNTMVESNLHSHLVEHLNAEIILGTIQNVKQATDWIKSTFLYLRVRRNPIYYDKSPDMSVDQLENSMYDMCMEALQWWCQRNQFRKTHVQVLPGIQHHGAAHLYQGHGVHGGYVGGHL